MIQRTADPAEGPEDQRLRRVARLLEEIEMEAVRLVDGSRGASALAIVSRAASARRYLDDLLDQEPTVTVEAAAVEAGYTRRIRSGIRDLGLSSAAAANLVGLTAEEIAALIRGVDHRLPLDLLERVATRLELEQQLGLDPLVHDAEGGG